MTMDDIRAMEEKTAIELAQVIMCCIKAVYPRYNNIICNRVTIFSRYVIVIVSVFVICGVVCVRKRILSEF